MIAHCGLGELSNDPELAYRTLVSGHQITGEQFTQAALRTGTDLYTERNIASQVSTGLALVNRPVVEQLALSPGGIWDAPPVAVTTSPGGLVQNSTNSTASTIPAVATSAIAIAGNDISPMLLYGGLGVIALLLLMRLK